MSRAATAVTPKPVAVAEAAGVAQSVQQAVFAKDHRAQVAVIDFLELTYNGGVGYKDGVDIKGHPILIEHEQEIPEGGADPTRALNTTSVARTTGQIMSTRYTRRKRIASFENLVKPIVDKFVAYLMRNTPKRSVKPEAIESLGFAWFIEEMVRDGLRLSECWIGVDSADLPEVNEETGQPLTVADANELDPEYGGGAYPIMVDPRRVVDWDEEDVGEITRAVVMSVETTKASFTSKPTSTVTFIEWTEETWTRYTMVNDNGETVRLPVDADLPQEVKVVADEPVSHSFGRCPWHRFRPNFPVEDLCELNRALFNMSSLLDEEMYQNTFTQKFVTGIRPDELKAAVTGPGNFMAFANPSATCGTFGSLPEQARNLMERIDGLRQAIYATVSMEGMGFKNAPEAAEKKKRDLESLYTMLVKLTNKIEQAENWMLAALGLIDPEDATAKTVYDRKFDVNSVADLLAELQELAKVPFVPASFKRAAVAQVLQKLDPFGDQAAYTEEMEEMIDVSPVVVESVVSLITAKYMTPELGAITLGIPEDDRQEFIDAVNGHAEDERMMQEAALAAKAAGDTPPGEDPHAQDAQDTAGQEEVDITDPEDQPSGD